MAQRQLNWRGRRYHLSGGKEPLFLRSLAAAYAETGRFSDAIAVIQQAVAIARVQGKTSLADLFEKDVVLYRRASGFDEYLLAINSQRCARSR